jgi:hypothetical protein
MTDVCNYSAGERGVSMERGGKAGKGAFRDDDIRIVLAVFFRRAEIMPKRETRRTEIL